MSFNSWDKLTKAQHDYPKPKFASAVVQKALKKQPKNPYLMVWKEDLALQQCLEPGFIMTRLLDIHHMPIVDTQLLSYMYKLTLEAVCRVTRRLDRSVSHPAILPCWQRAAKTLKRKEDRMSLWNELFKTALQEGVWDDVRTAISNYKKEGPSEKKTVHYSLILALQYASDQLRAAGFERVAPIHGDLALRMMRQAYDAPPNDPIAVKDITDLRFMGSVHELLGRAETLKELWDAPPEHLQTAMEHHHRETVETILMHNLKVRNEWSQLEKHCRCILVSTLSSLKIASPDSDSRFWQLCARRWDVWSCLIQALEQNHSNAEARDNVKGMLEYFFDTSQDPGDRPIRLSYMHLRSYTGVNMLRDCEDYFQRYCEVASCFEDLRPHLEALDGVDLRKFIVSSHKHLRKMASPDELFKQLVHGGSTIQMQEINHMKIQYWFVVSRALRPNRTVIEDLFGENIEFLATIANHVDIGYLAIYTLLSLHHTHVCGRENKNPLETSQNSRILLQATMLARHLVEKDKDKQNRTFALFAARLHLNLGLGLVAFRLYRHTNTKEMLLDTLSLYMLSRISQTHPFEVQGYRGFSADEELVRVLSTIERMESKTNSFLVADIPSFRPHQAAAILKIKMALQTSLTKHVCSLERRRIARLKGEPSDRVPRLDWKTFTALTDNTDHDIFPNFEFSDQKARVLDLAMPNGLATVNWYIESHITREHACQRLYNEAPLVFGVLDPLDREVKKKNKSRLTRIERRMAVYWDSLKGFMKEIIAPAGKVDTDDYISFREEIGNLRRALEKLRMPGNTTLKPEDEPTMFHENMLMACYQQLEVLCATCKLVEHLRELVLKTPKGGKPHPHKKILPAKYDTELLQDTQICYQAVRDVAQSYIDLILRRGVEAIKAQVRWGPTGKSLKLLLKDDDVEFYAQEYVESALEAWKGVLKVKLK